MYEALLMVHWREWKCAMPETPSGTEWISRTTQPDGKAAEEGKVVIYYADSNIWACSWVFPVWLVELFWTRRTDQTQVCAGNLPLSTGTTMFSLVFIIKCTPWPRFCLAFHTHGSQRSSDNLQPICLCFEGISGKTAGLSWCPGKLSVWQVGVPRVYWYRMGGLSS